VNFFVKIIIMMKYIFLFWSFVIVSIPVLAQDDVNLFSYWKYYSDAENTQYKYFCSRAFKLLDERKAEVAALKTRDDFLERQKIVKQKLEKILGSFPEKTPLNARVTGVIKRKDFRVEKVIYESMPGYYVTAALFVPNKIKKHAPAVIYASGHTTEGFRSTTYQHVIINLVKKGFIVLAFDPIGQGERLQYYDPVIGKSPFGATTEHSYPGGQCYISGYSPTKYFVWDAIRSVDYLMTRKEVDPERIGMTGRSGGGTQTAYAAAFDERIKATAPECFITSMSYVLKSIGPQDAEQNLFHMISEKLDHADLLEVRAPKPTLMITTTRDFFSIQGARETFREARNYYKAIGAEENMNMVEDDSVHISTKRNREAMYAFFQNALDLPGDPTDVDVEIFKEEELWATSTGQLITSLKGETIFSLNKKLVEKQIEHLELSRKDGDKSIVSIRASARKWSGFEYPDVAGKVVFSGRYINSDFVLEKYLVQGSGDYMLPAVLYKPQKNGRKKVILLLDEKGMEHAANKDVLAHELLKDGYAVILADLPGIGKLGPGYLQGDAYIGKVSYNQWFAGILVGKSIVGLQAEDIVRLSKFASNQCKNAKGIMAISSGVVGAALLHAGAFDQEIEKICLINAPPTYEDIAVTHNYSPEFIPASVAGAINDYDLTDLGRVLFPRKLLLVNPLSADGIALEREKANRTWAQLIDMYLNKGVPGNFEIITDKGEQPALVNMREWLK